MAFTLAALSVSAAAMPTVDFQNNGFENHNQDTFTVNESVAYFFNTVEHELLSIDDSDGFPFSDQLLPFYKRFSTQQRGAVTYTFQTNSKINAERAFVFKSYTKALIFPFHSHW
ncbi:hypothetical protein SCB49_09280 [unidentified eubacterium SCB49]|nr:hypothetical protein SCB49_09280 [unidentified eubacterium SCB49]